MRERERERKREKEKEREERERKREREYGKIPGSAMHMQKDYYMHRRRRDRAYCTYVNVRILNMAFYTKPMLSKCQNDRPCSFGNRVLFELRKSGDTRRLLRIYRSSESPSAVSLPFCPIKVNENDKAGDASLNLGKFFKDFFLKKASHSLPVSFPPRLITRLSGLSRNGHSST